MQLSKHIYHFALPSLFFTDEMSSADVVKNCPDGSVFKGSKKETHMTIIQYFGIITWPDGKQFEGEIYDNGDPKKGRMTFLNGDYFDGTYSHDRWTGEDEGILQCKNGDKQVGKFRLGNLCDGIKTFADGRPDELVLC